MISKENLRVIEHESKELFSKLGIEGEVRVEAGEENAVSISIHTAEPQLFIGDRGQALAEIQHILKFILKKKVLTFDTI